MSKETTPKVSVSAPESKPEPFVISREGAIANKDGSSVSFVVTGFWSNGEVDVTVTHHNKHGNITGRANGKVSAVSKSDFESKLSQINKPKT